ncbi:MAG: hypothetical protein WAU34_17350, partial [Desulfobacterales bacterium]
MKLETGSWKLKTLNPQPATRTLYPVESLLRQGPRSGIQPGRPETRNTKPQIPNLHSAPMPIIAVDNLSYRYPDGTVGLDRVTLS